MLWLQIRIATQLTNKTKCQRYTKKFTQSTRVLRVWNISGSVYPLRIQITYLSSINRIEKEKIHIRVIL